MPSFGSFEQHAVGRESPNGGVEYHCVEVSTTDRILTWALPSSLRTNGPFPTYWTLILTAWRMD